MANVPMKQDTPVNAQGFSALVSSEGFLKSVADVIPDYLTPETMIKLAAVGASRNPKLFECTKESLLKAIITSAQLGLDCSGATGEAYLVPHYNGKTRKMEAVFIQGYKGKIHIITREGGVLKVESRVVYEKDHFLIQYGTDSKIEHSPFFGADRGEIIGAYAVATLPGGLTQFEAMTREEIDKIKATALKKTKGYGPWKDHYPEMVRKTPIHRLAKTLPLPSKVRAELAMDYADDKVYTVEPIKNRAQELMDQKKIALEQKLNQEAAAKRLEELNQEDAGKVAQEKEESAATADAFDLGSNAKPDPELNEKDLSEADWVKEEQSAAAKTAKASLKADKKG